jgi:hypothetical protein
VRRVSLRPVDKVAVRNRDGLVEETQDLVLETPMVLLEQQCMPSARQ